MAVIAVYVDDLILSTKTSQEMQEAKESLQARFKMKDMGKLHYCLGISIEDEKCVWVHQKQYILRSMTNGCQAKSHPSRSECKTGKG